ncbi:MAG TPA: response regulator [Chroococcidiopsis sp.]
MARQKILIVDDSKIIRTQIREMLPKGNFEVLEAQDGVDALDIIAADYPNLILLDFFMPRMNGWEVVQKIQAHPRWQSIPVVMMSGRREDVEKAVPELFDYFEFLGKPFGAPVLLKAIKLANSKAKQRQEALKAMLAERAKRMAATPDAYSLTVEARAYPVSTAATAATEDTTDLAALKTEIEQLRSQNNGLKVEVDSLKVEVDSLKQQMVQLLTFLKKRVK